MGTRSKLVMPGLGERKRRRPLDGLPGHDDKFECRASLETAQMRPLAAGI
jgi:hypothetical protein